MTIASALDCGTQDLLTPHRTTEFRMDVGIRASDLFAIQCIVRLAASPDFEGENECQGTV
jgi:hypothetical protein